MEVPGKRSDIIITVGAAEELERLCEVCEVDHITTKAIGTCRDCEQFMCNTCFTTHIKVKSCRQHMLVDTDQSVTPVQRSSENVENCKCHINEKIKYYCRKHEAVGCSDCMIPAHGPCKPENIKLLSKQFHNSDYFKSVMKKLPDMSSGIHEHENNVQESKKVNQVMLEKALKEIKCCRFEINNCLDMAEASIIKDAKEIERSNSKMLAKLEQDCKLLSSKITEVRQKLDTQLYQDSALFIQTVDCKPSVLDIERAISQIQAENHIRTFEFMPDMQLQCIITATVKLGSIIKPSLTKPDTRKKTKAVKEPRPSTGITIGARVRPIGKCLERGHLRHKGQQGTVTAVNLDGTIIVKWDATGWKGLHDSTGCQIEYI